MMSDVTLIDCPQQRVSNGMTKNICVGMPFQSAIMGNLDSTQNKFAPGCEPMDFHAVVEAAVGGVWQAVDATALAPRQTMIRISTGRDASDTAFLTVQSGRADLVSVAVTATSSPDLPKDQPTDLVSLT